MGELMSALTTSYLMWLLTPVPGAGMARHQTTPSSKVHSPLAVVRLQQPRQPARRVARTSRAQRRGRTPTLQGRTFSVALGCRVASALGQARAAGITSARDRASHGGPSWAGNGLLSKPTAISNSSSESLEFVLCTANCA